MNMLSTITQKASVAALATFASASVWSQATWDWGGTCDPVTCVVATTVGSTVYNVKSTVSAWSSGAYSSNFTPGGVNDVDPYGLGIKSNNSAENTTSPNHAIDNVTSSGHGYEVLGISFTNNANNSPMAVNLSQVAAAWTYTDSDAMIFRWDGDISGGAPSPGMTTFSPNELPSTVNTSMNGWTLVTTGQFNTGSCSSSAGTCGSLGNTANSTDNPDKYSSYWLVSTYMTSGASGNNDGFKVKTFTASVCQYSISNGQACTAPPPPPTQGTPEPGTLTLALASGLGAWMIRRRRTAEHAQVQ